MNYFLKSNKNLLTYSLILLVIVPLFGINFLIGFLGNILLLLFLIPFFLLIIGVLVFNSLKSKINTPIACYQVSGEYSMLKAASKLGYLDYESVIYEQLISFKRAGAKLIASYFAKEIAKKL